MMLDYDYLDFLCLPQKLYEEIENSATQLLINFGIDSLPIDPILIAKKIGYQLIPYNQIDVKAKNILIKSETEGLSYFNPISDNYVIFYNSDGLEERIRFTIAHEIGHIQMGHRSESELARRVADYYAAYLLAPSPWIYFVGCNNYSDIKKMFVVSDACAARCFNRFKHWKNNPHTKSYENILIEFLEKHNSSKIIYNSRQS